MSKKSGGGEAGERADLGGERHARQRVDQTMACWPIVRFGAILSSTLARSSIRARFEHVGDRPAGERLVAGAVLRQHHAREEEAARRRRDSPSAETTPSIGAWITRLSMFCCARCMASCAFLRFSSTTASDA